MPCASQQSHLELLTPAATTISHQYLTSKLGGDMAAIRGMANYIARHTRHFAEYEAQVRASDWAAIEQQSGLTRADIVQAARLFAVSQRIISCWAMG